MGTRELGLHSWQLQVPCASLSMPPCMCCMPAPTWPVERRPLATCLVVRGAHAQAASQTRTIVVAHRRSQVCLSSIPIPLVHAHASGNSRCVRAPSARRQTTSDSSCDAASGSAASNRRDCRRQLDIPCLSHAHQGGVARPPGTLRVFGRLRCPSHGRCGRANASGGGPSPDSPGEYERDLLGEQSVAWSLDQLCRSSTSQLNSIIMVFGTVLFASTAYS